MVSKARHLASLAKTLNQNQNGEVELSTKLAPSTITPEMLNDSAGYSTGALITKVQGNYNIVNNTLNFVEAPYGNIPLSSTTNPQLLHVTSPRVVSKLQSTAAHSSHGRVWPSITLRSLDTLVSFWLRSFPVSKLALIFSTPGIVIVF